MAKIVLIEDEPGLRRATLRALRAGGHTVEAFENGRAAIEHLEGAPSDLLVTDIFMPEMEGLETIRRARALRPGLRIIAMSGFSVEDGDYLQIAEKFGAVASLKKPFRPAELLDLVARVLAEERC